MKYPKISIILSVYNSEKYLKDSINSILRQTFKNFEFLILNDGSTDNSDKIIRFFKKKDKRIKYFKRKNHGLTKSLNFLIKKTKSNIIARQDADDISDINRLKLQFNFLKKNKNCILLGSNGFKIDKNKKIIGNINLPLENIKLKKKLLFQNTFIHSSIMIRKETLKKINFFNEKFYYSQDYDCWCRASLLGEIYNLKERLVKLRIHDSSITTTKAKLQNWYAAQASINHLRNFYQDSEIKSYKKIIFFLKGSSLPRKYTVHLSQLTIKEKIKLLRFPITLIKRIFFK